MTKRKVLPQPDDPAFKTAYAELILEHYGVVLRTDTDEHFDEDLERFLDEDKNRVLN